MTSVTIRLLEPDDASVLELYINEVGVAPPCRNQGVGRDLLKALFAHGKASGCAEAWLGTERTNAAARRMYAAVGGDEENEDTVVVWFGRLE